MCSSDLVSPATLASVGLTEDDRALQWGKGWVSLQSVNHMRGRAGDVFQGAKGAATRRQLW